MIHDEEEMIMRLYFLPFQFKLFIDTDLRLVM